MATSAVSADPSAESESTPAASAGRRGLLLALELLLILLAIRLFRIEEQRGLFALVCLAAAGFLVHSRLSASRRLSFFLLVSLAAFPLAFAWPHLAASEWSEAAIVGLTQSAWVFGLGAGLIAICHLPVPFVVRAALLVAAGAGLAWWRYDSATPFWAILGSVFMFRLWIYASEVRREREPAPWPLRLAYFFLLPNAFFPFFPIVDYRRFRASYRPEDDGRVAQQGVAWILRGLTHLLLYRAVKVFLLPAPMDLIDAEYVALFLVTNYALYLRISGYFHVVTGLLHLFGFDVPRTHDNYFLASSLSDIWRRINIYWKDFLTEHVFLPTFFTLRRWPRWLAVVTGVGVVFTATWVLHSWQAFWLLGNFPLAGREAALWLSAGALVAVNSLWQYRVAAQHRSGPVELTPAVALRRSLQVAGTFLAVSFFWACWTVPQFPKLIAAVGEAGGFRAEALAKPAAVLLAAVAVGTVAQLVAVRLRRGGVRLEFPLERSPVACVAALLGLVAIGTPEVSGLLGHEAALYVAAVQSEPPVLADAVAGYYEQLAEANRQADPLLDIGRRAGQPGEVAYGAVSQRRAGVIGSELKPGVSANVYGVPFRTNRWGMRDDDMPRPKPPGVYRIALLGSSTTLGHAVPQDEDFESLLEKRINVAISPGGPRVELLNFAGPGYYGLQSAGVLREKALGFDPDAVYYVAHQGEYFGLPKHLTACVKSDVPLPYPCLDEIVRKAGVTDDTSWGLAEIKLRPHAKEMAACVYKGMVEDCRKRDVLSVWIYVPIPGVTQVTIDEAELKRFARDAGFVVVDLSGWSDGRTPADVKFDEADYHANALGHRLIAEKLFETLHSRPDALPPLAPSSAALDKSR